jgi:hypothetical protein
MEPPKSLRPTDRSRLTTLNLDEWKEDQPHSAHGRSRSVPPDLNGSPARQKGRIYKEYEDVESEDDSEVEEGIRAGRWERQSFPHVDGFGPSTYAGILSISQDDGTSLVLSIDGRRIDFQLSLVSFEEIKDGDDMGQLFDQYLVTFDRFVEDESVVQDPRLVMRWGGHQYVAFFFPPENLTLDSPAVTYGRKMAHQSWMLSYTGARQHSQNAVKTSLPQLRHQLRSH